MDRHYFDSMYRSDPDPWDFETSWYEERKYALTLALLHDRRYSSAFEPGCSVGVLTALLGQRCDRLLAIDLVPSAVERARDRCRGVPGVRVEEGAIPENWPAGPFDLVVLSEVAYYFDRHDLDALMAQVVRTTCTGATVIGVHWRGPTNYPLSGDEAHGVIDARPELLHALRYLETSFVIDVWQRPGTDGDASNPSIAAERRADRSSLP